MDQTQLLLETWFVQNGHENTAVAIRCYYEGIEGLTDQIELHYVSEVKPGYFWLFPAGEGRANIGIGLSKDDAKKEDRSLGEILKRSRTLIISKIVSRMQNL